MITRHFSLLILSALLASFSFGSQTSVVALDGYDVVSYFTQSKPSKGTAEFHTRWNDKEWHFTSESNLEKFAAAPERYAPQFDAHCANGLSDGHLVEANPLIYRVIDDRLYLFFSKWGRAQWAFNQEEQISLAEYWWSEFNQGN